MDGSAEAFTELVERARLAEQPLVRRALMVREHIAWAVREGQDSQ